MIACDECREKLYSCSLVTKVEVCEYRENEQVVVVNKSVPNYSILYYHFNCYRFKVRREER